MNLSNNAKEANIKQVLKLFFYKLAKLPGTSISHNVDQSAVEINYTTPIAKFHVRIYDDKILVFSNSKYDPVKQFDTYCAELVEYIETIITDSIERF